MCKLTLDAMQRFHALSKVVSADGSVDRKTKELVAIGVTLRCGGCITSLAKALKDLVQPAKRSPWR